MSPEQGREAEVERLANLIQEELGSVSIYLGPNAMSRAIRGEAIPLSLGEKWLISNIAARSAIRYLKGPAEGEPGKTAGPTDPAEAT